MAFQTRSDDSNGNAYPGLNFWPTLQDAHAAWQKDPTIWKISYAGNRWLWKRRGDPWDDYEPLLNCHEKYRGANPDAVFWFNRPLMGDINDLQKAGAVLTDEEFRRLSP